MAAAFALPALAANPQVEFDTTAVRFASSSIPTPRRPTVVNFLDYVKAKHFDGTQFHRVIPGFMTRAADSRRLPAKADQETGRQRSRAVEQGGTAERSGNDFHGSTSDPNSATAQFFINVNDNKSLNFRSADPPALAHVFGKVVSGMDVVDKIAKAPTGAGGPFPRTCGRKSSSPEPTSSTAK